MRFQKKDLPKPFDKSLIKSLKEINQLSQLNPSNKLKTFNFVGALALSDPDFRELTQMINQMERLSIWYKFLANFDEKNQIKDLEIHQNSLDKILGKPETKIQNLVDLVQNRKDPSINRLVMQYGPKYKSLLKNNDEELIIFKKEIDKRYRSIHKDASKQLKRIHNRFHQ
ncbi:MAG: hypothetical protein HeimC3_24400 [Candidatus Heimdallarchaeota archaeon LC_3]|nr:MAG: hypothetical protein HeimC3_24400 [Candidatus Heimdallarchaeota archaeon LC_3]